MVALPAPQHLTRSLTLPLAVLYGLGVTIGAGIHMLVGVAAGRSSMQAPLAFIGAALLPASGDIGIWVGLSGTTLIAVFAFIGFEHLVNVAEEMKNPRRTLPLATALGVGAILLLALAVSLSGLADLAARFTLVVFAIVNAALLRIKWQEAAPPVNAFACPRWVPAAGLISSLGLLVLDQAVR